MYKAIVFTLIILTSLNARSQDSLTKTLIFYEDSLNFASCGVIQFTHLLYFVSDTSASKIKNADYYIAITCPELYGKDFFRKRSKYLMELYKDYDALKPLLSPDTLDSLYNAGKIYVMKKIQKL